ncbi:MEKHLA domain-containing protein [Streptomyces sp. NPDC048473]|uniref:MEKHLA domain-containing protein n=1 Tax=unclassified Streptomyces TaxID=2593676 RepID=UPI003716CD43
MPSTPTDASFAELVRSSHRRLTGRDLSASIRDVPADEAAEWLYTSAPFGLLAHDTGMDPRFVYANRTAQKCFGYEWDEFVGMPSRLSAVPDDQEDRNAFVRSVTEQGYAERYRGRRRAKSGRRFWIENVTMWDLLDSAGVLHGQAAIVPMWTETDA